MSSEKSVQWVNVCVYGALLSVIGTGCVVTSRSPMAEHVRVCGKLYKPETTVVVVREEPQWLSVYDDDCSGSSLVSPQAKTKEEGKAELSKVLDVASLHLQGFPRFVSPGVGPSVGTKGGGQGAVARAGLPVIPMSTNAKLGSPLSVQASSSEGSRSVCALGQSLLQTDVSFPRGVHEVSGPEREKLSQLRGRPISYVLIEGLTEVPGLTSSMVPVAQARARAVQRVLQDALAPGASIQQGLRAGCCTKKGEPGSTGKDDVGVSVSACMGTVTGLKKGETSSMAK